MDYAEGNFVGYLEIDPTFNVTSGDDGWFRDGNGDNVCSTASLSQIGTAVLEPHIYGGGSSYIDCQVAYIEFPVSGFPSSVTVTDVELDFYVVGVTTPDSCDVRPITSNQPSVSTAQNIFNEIMGATDYTQLTECQSTGQKSNMSLGSQAVTDFDNSITSGWFALGLKQDTDTVNSNKITTIASASHSTYDPPKLTVSYSLPLAPQSPTNLSTVTGIPIELDWDSPVTTVTPTASPDEDFSTDNWIDNDSTNIGVSSNSLNWNAKRDGSNDASTHDLGSTVSDNWLLRFKVDVTNVNTSTQAGNGFFVGLSDKPNTDGHTTSQDFIGVGIYNDNTDSYRTIDTDGAGLPYIYQGDSNQSTTYDTGSTWYYEIIKEGSSYTVEAFSNSDYSTGSEGKITGSSSASGLQYLKVLNHFNCPHLFWKN